jgi:hypothetical protein
MGGFKSGLRAVVEALRYIGAQHPERPVVIRESQESIIELIDGNYDPSHNYLDLWQEGVTLWEKLDCKFEHTDSSEKNPAKSLL